MKRLAAGKRTTAAGRGAAAGRGTPAEAPGTGQTEAALRESEEHYRTLFNAVTDAVFVHEVGEDGMAGRFLEVNDVACRRLGYTREELLRMAPTDIDAPEAGIDIRPFGVRVIAGETVQFEQVHVAKDGRRIPVEIRVQQLSMGGRAVVLSLARDITERKRAEESLAKSERMLQAIIEAEPECVKLLDANGNLIMMNRAGLAMIQVDSLEQVQGRNIGSLVSEGQREAFMDLTRRVFQGQSGTLLFEITGMQGRHLWLETHAVPLRNEKDEIMALLGVTRDVTERRRAEEEARRSEARMASLYRISQQPAEDERAFLDFALHEALSLTGSAIGYLCSYDAAKRKFELNSYSRDVMKECSIADRKTCYELERTGIWGEAVRQRKPILLNDYGAEHPLKKGYPEGHARLRNYLTVPVIMQGAVVAVVGVANKPADYADADVLQLNFLMDSVWKMVQRARAERALQVSEERFRDLAESLPLTVFEMDLQGRFTYVNRAAREQFGYSQQEAEAGLQMVQVIAPADRERARDMLAQRLAGRKEGYVEYQGLRKDGTTFPITVASSPIIRDGRPVGLRGIVTDLSERKLLEEERLKSQKLESIGTLAGGIAHDFNNLLQGVFGHIALAKLSLDEKKRALAMLEQAEKALHRSVGLTSQLLTFSKGGTPVKKVIGLRQVIEDAVQFALSGSAVGHELAIDRDLQPVAADEGQIGQVIQNIVLNADQAMAMGGTISIAARNSVDRRGFVEISIRDSGVGIPPEYLGRIFDPYFTTKERGSGLGLATSYSIIRNHGGTITATSEVGRGTQFTISLPAAPEGAGGAQAPPEPEALCRRCRILVMDDEEIVRTVAAELLRTLGHEAEVAGHGAAAVEMYRRARESGRPYDAVILDLTVRGGMGGRETLLRLKELDPAVLALVSSGYSDDAAVADHRQHGFRAFLRKPYNLSGLREALNAVLFPGDGSRPA